MGMQRPEAAVGRIRPPRVTDAATPVTLPVLPLRASAGRTERPVMDVKNTNVKPWPKQGMSEHMRAAPAPIDALPSREQAGAAGGTLLAYATDDPSREGVLETPKPIIVAYDESYQTY